MHLLTYALFRTLGALLSLLPYRTIHALGRILGSCLYFLHRPFRKKALANLDIAFGTTLSEKERKRIARRSFQHLLITCLEFFRVKRSQGLFSKIVTFTGDFSTLDLLEKKQGVIFLSAHQANWEIPFLAMTEKYPGVAIGRPIRNKRLYRWVLSVREMNKGKIVTPRNAIKHGLRALKEGKFLGIVGDQALPESSYSYPLFGTRAWTSSTPALLAYRTGCPLVVGTTRRVRGKYVITGGAPLWPNLAESKDIEVPRLMNAAMEMLEKSIRTHPSQWMWVHDRWKQQGIDHMKRPFRFGFVLILLPPHPQTILPELSVFRTLYPRSFLTFFAPKGTVIDVEGAQVLSYSSEEDFLVRDYRYQIVFDLFDSSRARRHFLRLGAFKTLNVNKLKKMAPGEHSLGRMLQRALVKKECLPTDFS